MAWNPIRFPLYLRFWLNCRGLTLVGVEVIRQIHHVLPIGAKVWVDDFVFKVDEVSVQDNGEIEHGLVGDNDGEFEWCDSSKNNSDFIRWVGLFLSHGFIFSHPQSIEEAVNRYQKDTRQL